VWVSSQQPLAIVVNPAHWIADAYVSQQDLLRIKAGNVVRFYPEDDPLFPVKGEVVEVDTHRVTALPHPLLSARYGGALAVLQDNHGLTPRDALYRVRIRFPEPLDRLAIRRGSALIDASPRSWLVEAAKTVLVVLIREATF
jgi:putative peptide zinc metalloprotease protein